MALSRRRGAKGQPPTQHEVVTHALRGHGGMTKKEIANRVVGELRGHGFLEMDKPSVWVLVEHEDTSDYGYGGEIFQSRGIGQVWGPFPTEEAARAYGVALNEARGYYTWNGREHRQAQRDFEEREVQAP